MGAYGRDKARAYDWTRVAGRVLDFYEETIDRQMEDSAVPSGRVEWAPFDASRSGWRRAWRQ